MIEAVAASSRSDVATDHVSRMAGLTPSLAARESTTAPPVREFVTRAATPAVRRPNPHARRASRRQPPAQADAECEQPEREYQEDDGQRLEPR